MPFGWRGVDAQEYATHCEIRGQSNLGMQATSYKMLGKVSEVEKGVDLGDLG